MSVHTQQRSRGAVTFRVAGVLVAAMVLQACKPSPPPPPPAPKETTLQKQTRACTDDVKLGLNDPASLEVVTVKEIPLDNGGIAIDLDYTAKNAMGGRVRGQTFCVFKEKQSVVLDEENRVNQVRKMMRTMNELGIRTN
ncbi:hypothetical protein [Hydrogenophaga laconesensis]|uniref:Lipoprotein n=1 Tax=Hydrogenophaga laconesensis TaxID=1805971 RepID=A0ABU1VHZ0_9BURK|nr:hypothetical protein [Hydrogenophaga laconesensis]MDR7097069.1 hypothetical protein [Hydrogenophaga laconesensis]